MGTARQRNAAGVGSRHAGGALQSRLAVDSYHMLAMSTPLDALDDVDPEKILFVQLADFMWQEVRSPDERMNTARHFRVFPGEGVHSADIAELVRRLDAIGYRGDYSSKCSTTTTCSCRSQRWRPAPGNRCAFSSAK